MEQIATKKEIPQRPDRLWSPPNLLYNECRGLIKAIRFSILVIFQAHNKYDSCTYQTVAYCCRPTRIWRSLCSSRSSVSFPAAHDWNDKSVKCRHTPCWRWDVTHYWPREHRWLPTFLYFVYISPPQIRVKKELQRLFLRIHLQNVLLSSLATPTVRSSIPRETLVILHSFHVPLKRALKLNGGGEGSSAIWKPLLVSWNSDQLILLCLTSFVSCQLII
jgi:hypothetical protein